MHIVAQDVCVHALTVLVDAQAQAAAHLLALAHFAARLLERADLEYVGIVPALPQSGVGKDEPNRRALGIAVQKQLFVLHDQVIGILVVGELRLLIVAGNRVHDVALLVDGEIARVGIGSGNRVQIGAVLPIVKERALQGLHHILIFLLKHIRKDAVIGLPRGVILLVVRHFVDKEQAQHLDALVEELALPLDMTQDCLTDLQTAQLLLTDLANHIPCKDLLPVQEFHGIVASVDGLDHIADLVLIQSVGVVEKIEAYADSLGHLPQSRCALVVKLDRGRGIRLREVDALQIDIALCSRAPALRDALDGDLLNQTLVIGLHSVQPIDHVIDAVRSVGGGIAQGQHGLELLQVLLGLFALHRLRLIDD